MTKNNPLIENITICKKAFLITFAFSFAVNILMLITPLYSLQVLDRVISSGSRETLLMLTLIMFSLYISLTLLQISRSFTLIKIGEWLDQKLSPELFGRSLASAAIKATVGTSQNLRDLNTVKNFLTSAGINTLFDAPWSIVYIIILFLIHPYIGLLTVIGGLLLFLFAVFNAYATTSKIGQASEAQIKSMAQADIATRNAEVIEAMGMNTQIVTNWYNNNRQVLLAQSTASYRNSLISNLSKFIRMIIQMLVTGIGAYLALDNQMTVGSMIACSIIVGRALAPFDSAIEVWKSITSAKKSYERLKEVYNKPVKEQIVIELPKPEGKLHADNISFVHQPDNFIARDRVKQVLKSVSFSLNRGEILAVIGPSAAGKSTLAKIIVGVWKSTSGTVRLDGADVYTWKRDNFGKYVGYLPQAVELFSGTVKENIARMNLEAKDEDIITAAKLAGAHEMILRLSAGYDTDIGVAGSALSAGQRQRVGLARAFYGSPSFIILDEPNANLDEAGEQALVEAINNARSMQITTIIISHRPSILSSVDKILLLKDGQVAIFDERDIVLEKMSFNKR